MKNEKNVTDKELRENEDLTEELEDLTKELSFDISEDSDLCITKAIELAEKNESIIKEDTGYDDAEINAILTNVNASDEDKLKLLAESLKDTEETDPMNKFMSTENWYGKRGQEVKIYMARDLYEAQQKGRVEYTEKVKKRKAYIQRQAFNQKDIPVLSDRIPNEYLKVLMTAVMKPYALRLDKCAALINKKVGYVLCSMMPSFLRNCYRQHRTSFQRHPGFLYRASAENGDNNVFWCEPDAPVYFEPNTEMTIIKEAASEGMLKLLDNTIITYKRAQNSYTTKLRVATRILSGNVTYLYLVKHKPLWFDTLYTIITNKEL